MKYFKRQKHYLPGTLRPILKHIPTFLFQRMQFAFMCACGLRGGLETAHLFQKKIAM